MRIEFESEQELEDIVFDAMLDGCKCPIDGDCTPEMDLHCLLMDLECEE